MKRISNKRAVQFTLLHRQYTAENFAAKKSGCLSNTTSNWYKDFIQNIICTSCLQF